MSSSTGKPPPGDKPVEAKPRKRGLFRGKKGDDVPREEESKEAAKRFQDFFEKA